MKILVVEDDIRISGFIVKGLKESGLQAESVDNGEDALNHILHDESIGLIILDIMIPKMNGLEVLAKVREAGKSTPVLR